MYLFLCKISCYYILKARGFIWGFCLVWFLFVCGSGSVVDVLVVSLVVLQFPVGEMIFKQERRSDTCTYCRWIPC